MAKKAAIGEMDRRIVIQEETATRGSSGQEILSWATLYTCWAKLAFPSTGSGEQVSNDQVIVTTRADFIIRKRDGIDEKVRIVYGGSNYSIVNINEHGGRNEFLLLQAQKVE